MEVTLDKFELPVFISDYPEELSRITGVKETTIRSTASHAAAGTRKHCRFIWVEFEEDEDEDIHGDIE